MEQPDETVQGNARRLSADAAFVRLPRPVYDPDVYGVRPGAERVAGVLAAVLLLAAPTGAWLRVTSSAAPDDAAVVEAAVLGTTFGVGRTLTLAGVLAVLCVLLLGHGRRRHRIGLGAGVGAVAIVAIQAAHLQSRIGAEVTTAIASADVSVRTVGVGWGAWSGLAGAALLALALQLAHLARIEQRRPAPAAPRLLAPMGEGVGR